MDAEAEIQVKHGELRPSTLTLSLPGAPSEAISLHIEICKNEAEWLNDAAQNRKYFFIIEELDEES